MAGKGLVQHTTARGAKIKLTQMERKIWQQAESRVWGRGRNRRQECHWL